MTRGSHMTLITTLCLAATAVGAFGQDGPRSIRWKTEDQGAGVRAAVGQSAEEVLDANPDRHVVLQFETVPGPAERAELQGRGVSLLRYLGDGAYFAKVEARRQARQPAGKSRLHKAMPIARGWKIHPRLGRGDVPEYARIPAGVAAGNTKRQPNNKAAAPEPDLVALYVVFHPDVDLATTGAAAVGKYGGEVRTFLYSINGAVIWLPSTQLDALADEDAVEWVEPPLPPMDVSNDGIRAATGVSVLHAPPYNLNGAGINVMVYDGGTAMANHPDLQDRVFVRDSSGVSDHPTHVSGTLGGTGAASGGQYTGMAPGVTIQSFGFEYDGTGQFLYTNPGDLESDYNKAINTYGVMIANNSIGTNVASNGYPCEWEGDYGATDMIIDAIVRGSLGAPMRIIWANGNERGSGRCGADYRTTAPPACAKNHITVGAINSNDGSMTSFSSWGPTDDGRIKPDVCAPGCQTGGDNGITSSMGGGGYGVMCGTSMAAPTVTGLSALLLQDWQAAYPGEPLPPNCLLKVLLTHNATDLGQPGPDYKFGFGSVRIQQTIDFLRSGSFAEGVIDHGQEVLYFVPVGAATGNTLRVTMAWDDPPGSPNTVPELVNDLDLVLLSPSGVTCYPWTLDPANPAAAAVRTAPDRRNNIEQVVVENPQVGNWTVVVRGYSVAVGPQSFALAATPELRTCSSSGLVAFKSPKYGCSSQLQVVVKDCDLDTNPQAVETVAITISSLNEPAGESVVLTETAPGSATFEGALQASTADSPGTLWVGHGDVLTAAYIDANDGEGNIDVLLTSTAVTDCQSPVVSGLAVSNVTASSARIAFSTNEPAQITLRYGTSCGDLTQTFTRRQFTNDHVITLKDLSKDTQYFYLLEVDDEAGNRTTLNNSGACFNFRTLDRQDYFTELFTKNEFDLDGRALMLAPDQSIHRYNACLESISVLPVVAEDGAALPLNDDSAIEVVFASGKKFPFYGVQYSSCWVSSNGFITFGGPDTDYTESLADHFSKPRVCPLFNDFNPSAGGSVTWQQFSDRIVFSWLAVPEFGITNTNTFQLVLHFNGTIHMAWLGVASTEGLVGISPGLGVPATFVENDLSESPACSTAPAKAFAPDPTHTTANASVIMTLHWRAGWRATSHEIFFGTSPLSLSLQAAQTGTSFALPTLANERTYYWRVDELNASGRAIGDLWNFTTKPLQPDFDGDGDVDMTDFAHLQLCYSGADVLQTQSECQDALLDDDGDVDPADADLFLNCLSGSDKLATGACLP